MIRHGMAVLLLSCLGVSSATDVEQIIDDILEPALHAGGTGFAVLVRRDGETVLRKGYGNANIEARLPMTPDAAFYIASMSKQFTAAVAMRLVEAGQIDLDAPIDRYLPTFPAYGSQIRVRDLLHHTAGLREYTSLHLIAGGDRRYEDALTMGDAWRTIVAQDHLDFAPGSDYRYSSSNYIVLTRLLEAVTGRPLQALAEAHFFGPLGMSRTHFESDPSRLVRHRVQSYQVEDDGSLRRYAKRLATYGDGGVLTTLDDMARWDAFLDREQEAGSVWWRLMTDRGRLRDGRAVNYAGGLWFGELSGHPTIQHGGGMYGFISDQIRLPGEGLSVYLFANWNGNGAFQARRIAEVLVDHVQERRPQEAPEALGLDGLDGLSGYYFIDRRNNRRYLKVKDGAIRYGSSRDSANTVLTRVAADRLLFPDGVNALRVHPRPSGGFDIELEPESVGYGWYAEPYVEDLPATAADLLPLAGRYASSELGVVYDVTVADGRLDLSIDGGEALRLFPADEAWSPLVTWNRSDVVWIGFAMLKFRRDQNGLVHHLDVGDLRVSGVRFERIGNPDG